MLYMQIFHERQNVLECTPGELSQNSARIHTINPGDHTPKNTYFAKLPRRMLSSKGSHLSF